MRPKRRRNKSTKATAPAHPRSQRAHRARSTASTAPPPEPTPSPIKPPTIPEGLPLTEWLGARVIYADPNHPVNVQRRRDEQELQQATETERRAKEAAQKAEARAARFSGRHQEHGDLWQVLDAILRDTEYQGKSWKSIMREAARRLDDGRVVGDRLYYRDSSLGTLDIASAAFQAKLSTVQHAQKKS